MNFKKRRFKAPFFVPDEASVRLVSPGRGDGFVDHRS